MDIPMSRCYQLKERPRCRKIVEQYLRDGFTLEALASKRPMQGHKYICLGDGIRIQARKMLYEKNQKE